MAIYENPANGYRKTFHQGPVMIFTLLFGTFYFIYRGLWKHAFLSLFAAIITLGFSWLIYPLFSYQALCNYYLERGWKQIEP